MQRFAVIGLGRFGARLASNLAEAGHEVVALDRDLALVETIRDRVTVAVALDSTDEDALRGQGVDQVDAAVVSIGKDFEATTLTTVVLKQIGVKRVVARAVSPTSAEVLSRIGADEVVMPEDESADRWSSRLVAPQFRDQIELDDRHSIVEVKPPGDWVGKTLIDLKLRASHGLHVIAIKRASATPGSESSGKKTRQFQLPHPDVPIGADDVLVVLASDDDLANVPRES